LRVNSVQVDNKIISITGKLIKTARIEEEWYHDVENPASLIKGLKESKSGADIFTFWQRLPEAKPKYNYYMEWDAIAALPIKSFDYWYKKQIDNNARRAIKRAEARGVEVKVANFDDDFVKGMTSIFNETPIRQGKPFWHYGKDMQTVRKEFSRYLYREDLIGAYYNGELIGFIMLAHAGKYALTGQIISKIAHRDKSPNNALIAKAVEFCENKKIPYLVYFMWGRGSFSEFKRRNGFEKTLLPRYYIPLTIKGAIALKLHLHHGFVGILPEKLILRLIGLRSKWYARKYQEHKG
jgi:hypothetical protein